jgi:outer membrane protein assembly factor BamB
VKSETRVVVGVLVPALLGVALVIAACGSAEETTTAAPAVTTSALALTTTILAPTSTTIATPSTTPATSITSTTTSVAAGTGTALCWANLERTGVYESPGPVKQPKLLWKFKTGSAFLSSPPTVLDGTVYISCDDRYLYAVDTAAGKEKWRFETPTHSGFYRSPAVSDGVVYCGSDDGNLYALDAQSGREIWKFTTDGAVRTSPAISAGVLYFGSHDGSVYALDARSGRQTWKFTTGSSVDCSPALSGGVLCVGTTRGVDHVYGVDSSNGNAQWSLELKSSSMLGSAAIAEGIVYFVDSNGGGKFGNYLRAVDIGSGKEKWKLSTVNYGRITPAVSQGVVYFVNGGLFALNAQSGKKLWEFEPAGGLCSDPAISEGIAYVGGFRGDIYAVDLLSGKQKWKVQVGSPQLESGGVNAPVVSDGMIFVSCNDGYVYALK